MRSKFGRSRKDRVDSPLFVLVLVLVSVVHGFGVFYLTPSTQSLPSFLVSLVLYMMNTSSTCVWLIFWTLNKSSNILIGGEVEDGVVFRRAYRGHLMLTLSTSCVLGRTLIFLVSGFNSALYPCSCDLLKLLRIWLSMLFMICVGLRIRAIRYAFRTNRVKDTGPCRTDRNLFCFNFPYRSFLYIRFFCFVIILGPRLHCAWNLNFLLTCSSWLYNS